MLSRGSVVGACWFIYDRTERSVYKQSTDHLVLHTNVGAVGPKDEQLVFQSSLPVFTKEDLASLNI